MDEESLNPLLVDRLWALANEDQSSRLPQDPVQFAHAVQGPGSQELAGFLAASLAYGRVSLFSPVIRAVIARGLAVSPSFEAYVRGLDAEAEREVFAPWFYRWTRGPDLLLLLQALGRVVQTHGSLGALVQVEPGESDLGPALSRLIGVLREAVVAIDGRDWAEQPKGVRYALVDPADGSASKRLLMFARWMVRSPDGIDLGLWSHVSPRHLVMPIDTHVHRISRMVGLTTRNTADWRTALELTAALRTLDPEDPVRFDFALAHVGISGGCKGVWVPEVCGACAIRAVCTVGSP